MPAELLMVAELEAMKLPVGTPEEMERQSVPQYEPET
jgi:hypothetical protein